MDELASVAVGGVFLISGAARGVNVTRGGEMELYLDTLQGAIAANQSLATLAVTTTEPTATVVFGPVRLSSASSNVFVAGATMGVIVGGLGGNISVSLDGGDGTTGTVSLAVGLLSGRIVSDTPLASLTVRNTTSTSTVTVAGVGNLTGVAAGVVFRSNDTTTVVSASRVGCPSQDEAGYDTTTDTAVLSVDKGVSELTVAEVRASTVSFWGGVRLAGDADALNVTALAGTATANTSPLAVVGIGNVSGAVTVALDADVRVDTFTSGRLDASGVRFAIEGASGVAVAANASSVGVAVSALSGSVDVATGTDGTGKTAPGQGTDALVGLSPTPTVNTSVGTVEVTAHIAAGDAVRIDGAADDTNVVVNTGITVRVGHLAGRVTVDGSVDVSLTSYE